MRRDFSSLILLLNLKSNLLAHLNSQDSTVSPARITRSPGPGSANSAIPTPTRAVPMTPMTTLLVCRIATVFGNSAVESPGS